MLFEGFDAADSVPGIVDQAERGAQSGIEIVIDPNQVFEPLRGLPYGFGERGLPAVDGVRCGNHGKENLRVRIDKWNLIIRKRISCIWIDGAVGGIGVYWCTLIAEISLPVRHRWNVVEEVERNDLAAPVL